MSESIKKSPSNGCEKSLPPNEQQAKVAQNYMLYSDIIMTYFIVLEVFWIYRFKEIAKATMDVVMNFKALKCVVYTDQWGEKIAWTFVG